MPKITGPDYKAELDEERLSTQMDRIRSLMLDGRWRTYGEVSLATGAPTSSVGSQLRNLRMRGNGMYLVERRRRGWEKSGLYEYRVSTPEKDRKWYVDELARRQGIFDEVAGRYMKAKHELAAAKRDLQYYDTPQGDLFQCPDCEPCHEEALDAD